MLDLFAGTGQLGHRGAFARRARAVFVDRRTDAVKLIRENLALTRLEEGAQVVCGDSMAYLNARVGNSTSFSSTRPTRTICSSAPSRTSRGLTFLRPMV